MLKTINRSNTFCLRNIKKWKLLYHEKSRSPDLFLFLKVEIYMIIYIIFLYNYICAYHLKMPWTQFEVTLFILLHTVENTIRNKFYQPNKVILNTYNKKLFHTKTWKISSCFLKEKVMMNNILNNIVRIPDNTEA